MKCKVARAAVPISAALLTAGSLALLAQETTVDEQASPDLKCRFVGQIIDVELPREPLEVIPVGYDPRFALHVKVLEIVDGSLPWIDTPLEEPVPIAFLIHSPTIFFALNLRKSPDELGDIANRHFLFTLSGNKTESGYWEYDLRMEEHEEAALEPTQEAAENDQAWTGVRYLFAIAFVAFTIAAVGLVLAMRRSTKSRQSAA